MIPDGEMMILKKKKEKNIKNLPCVTSFFSCLNCAQEQKPEEGHSLHIESTE